MVGGEIVEVGPAEVAESGAKIVLEVNGLCAPRTGLDDTALRDISFVVRQGEVLGIAGVDGNGQTELFEALIGLRPLDSARIRKPGAPHPIVLAGAPAGFMPSPDRMLDLGVAWIPPDRRREGLALTQSVERNLLLGAVRGRSLRFGPIIRRSRMRRQAMALMDRFDIRAASPTSSAESLSGGNQQKIVVARAVSENPKLLIASSPTRGLDVGAAAYVHGVLDDCRMRGGAVLLLSTELEEIRLLANRIAVMYEGRIMGILPGNATAEQIGLLMGGSPVDGKAAT
jgi:simple sugar transport system ATP-binding protein